MENATIAPARPQYMHALARANEVRLARAALKRRVARGELTVSEVVLDQPWEVESMPMAELLCAQRRWGTTRCRRFLAAIPMSESKTVGSMTERQRLAVARMLAGAHASAPEPVGVPAFA